MMAEGREENGHFAKGNRIWETRSSAGIKPLFTDPEKLWEACVEYFEWVDKNPLHEAKAFSYEGKVHMAELPKMRAMTIAGLCIFLDIARSTWDEWKKNRSDLAEVIKRVEEVIYEQKFTGASAGLLQPQIIARDLGLADRTEHTGRDGGPIQYENLSDEELDERIAELKAREKHGGDE